MYQHTEVVNPGKAHAKAMSLALILLAMLACLVPASGFAQEAGAESLALEEVIVTAQKREQSMLEVPISVSALDADILASSGLDRMTDYAAQIPGMSTTAVTRGYTSVVLRGISTGISQATPSTAFYIDEAPIGSITAYATGSTLTPDIDPYDLQRVEVLKGPQGTLYGAGAVGGLLRYVTKLPNPEEFSGAFTLGYNSVEHGDTGWEARAAFNAPVSDNSALRFSVFSKEEAGWIDNPVIGDDDVNNARSSGGRLAYGWDINDDWSLQLWGLTQDFHAGGLGVEDVVAPGMQPLTGEMEHSSFVPEIQDIEFNALNATVKGDIGDFSLVSSTTFETVSAETHVDQSRSFGFLLGLILGIPNLGAETVQMIDTERWAEEIRVSSLAFDDKLRYELGFFYTKEDSSNSLPPNDIFLTPSATPFPLGIPLADALIEINYKEYSFFGNASYAITEKFEVLAGLRFSQDDQHYYQNYKRSLLTAIPILIEQDVSNDKTTYLLNASYKFTEEQNLYARVATGYRPGGPSALPPNVVPGGKTSFDPDTLTSYELGYKASLLDGRATLETALFTTDWEDIQIQTSAQTPAGTFQYFVNGGTATSKGAEVTFTLLPIEGLTLRTTGGYTNAELTEDVPRVGGRDGDRLPFVPEWTASFVANYQFTLGSQPAWAGGSVNYIGERVSNFSQRFNSFDVPTYTTVNLNTGMELGQFDLNLYVRNLADERGVTFMNNVGLQFPPINNLGNPYVQGVIQPRTIGAELTWNF
jgi:iron complex outermembrane receptor protein